MISPDELHQLAPYAHSKVELFVDPLNAAMNAYEIDNPLREAAFLAQILHESGEFRYVQELASGEAYEGRTDLGNTQEGDGAKYKGRGLLQITGRNWYQRVKDELGLDCIEHPELFEEVDNACRVSAWWWFINNLNSIADQGDIRKITLKVNGGFNGLAERTAYYQRALALFGVQTF